MPIITTMTMVQKNLLNKPVQVQVGTSQQIMIRSRPSHSNRMSYVATIMAFMLASKAAVSTESPAEDINDFNRNDWYQRYPAYPPYCSIPAAMANRAIPPVADDVRLGESRLVHVTAIFRHGARTPYKGDLNCWDGYLESAETGVWNCDLNTLTSPPTPKVVSEDEGQGNQGGDAMFLFEKRYDALSDSKDNLSNSLNGTCEMGQLILRGYDQEIVNGEHLRQAYIYDDRNMAHDPTMRLIDVSGEDHKFAWGPTNIFYRVDDDQRTIMSGQVLMRGMLGPEIKQFFDSNKHYPVIPLHTVDRENDIVDPNERTCPRLTEIRERFERSHKYRSFNQSPEAVQLRSFMKNVLKIDGDMDATDCLMTTICTDRPLPDAINDYTGGDDDGNDRRREDGDSSDDGPSSDSSYGTNMFQRLYDFDVKKYALNILANDSEYAKLGMGPLWAEIMANINGIINEQDSICCPERHPVKLALFSGHDTTLIPLLASLNAWDGEWPAYASMMLIEIHEVNIDGRTDKSLYKSNYAFRLVYNGKVVTHTVDGCPDDAELCDATVLTNRVSDFATVERECARRHDSPEEYTDTVSRAKEFVSTTGGVIAFALLVVGSALVGAIGTFFYLTGAMPSRRREDRTSAVESYEEGGIALTSYDENGDGSSHYTDGPEESYGSHSRAAEAAALQATIT